MVKTFELSEHGHGRSPRQVAGTGASGFDTSAQRTCPGGPATLPLRYETVAVRLTVPLPVYASTRTYQYPAAGAAWVQVSFEPDW